ncbi:MAG: DUF2934 domain-containing protein [Chloroflexi bacterium]|nr:DUF2934 domain-containing protein [Chloroflexota bacterium]
MTAERQIMEDQVKEIAYSIWEKEGRPEGKDVEHYYRAKAILEQRSTDYGTMGTRSVPADQGKAGSAGESHFARRHSRTH